MQLQIKKITDTAVVPFFAHDTDAGMDFCADEDVVIAPGERAVISTGIAVAIPTGYVGLFWDKSGVSTKKGLKTLAGVIDAGYRGEVKVCLFNTSNETQTFTAGDKIAQMLIQKIEKPNLAIVASLDETDRGEGGFGSTGTK